MKRWIGLVAMGLGAVLPGRAAEEKFTQALRAEDFSAAGLGKLSPQELARLDALVRDFRSGALEAARREAEAAAQARTEAEARAARAEESAKAARAAQAADAARAKQAEGKKSEGSLLDRAKVLLMPGTEIEFVTIESRIVGEFRGWEGRTLFTLENGQRWQVESGTYVSPPMTGPAVKIVPGVLGSFYMLVDGVRPRVKVKLVGGAK